MTKFKPASPLLQTRIGPQAYSTPRPGAHLDVPGRRGGDEAGEVVVHAPVARARLLPAAGADEVAPLQVDPDLARQRGVEASRGQVDIMNYS